ncbi:MAG: RND transporter, partial [Lachnospiraceae bacterium]|nr:RND transporter [Lachnospiraceae bacterium]
MEEFTIKKKEELDPQEKSFRRRKDIIKNVIIVFLVVMLGLTFFSNTIQNYSLPKVAVQYIEPGTITTVIRGEGVVESGDPYNVMVKYSKTVGSINAKVGTEV